MKATTHNNKKPVPFLVLLMIVFFLPSLFKVLPLGEDLGGAAFAQSNRLWATYYGGTETDAGYSVATDAAGNVYMAGSTKSNSDIAFGGFQNIFVTEGGEDNAFLVKFDAFGNRLWATYYGGAGDDYRTYDIATDPVGNVYLAGRTSRDSGIASNGFQNTFGSTGLALSETFLVKFDASGNRLWATYYGARPNLSGAPVAVTTDVWGNVYLAGTVDSASYNIAFGGFQNTYIGGNFEAFLVKFDAFGNRLWGTYYGGPTNSVLSAYPNWLSNTAGDIATDLLGNVYLTGTTTNDSNIATSNGFQSAYGGFEDAFLVKFDASGNRLWATYFGGSGHSEGQSVATDATGNVYIAGNATANGIDAFSGFQNTFAGSYGWDKYLAKFDAVGNRLWATYYGGSDQELGFTDIVTDTSNKVYLAGTTSSNSNIAFGGFQNTRGGSGTYSSDAFLVKFDSSGNRLCATYYGMGVSGASGIAANSAGYIYLTGGTSDTLGMASSGSFQNTFGGNSDAFLVKFISCNDTTLNVTTTATNSKCDGACTGTAIATPINGKSPYTYSWNTSPIQTASTASNLCEGIYTVTVTDAANSTAMGIVFVRPTPIKITVGTTPAYCTSKGTAKATAISGIPEYSYLWTGGQTTQTATALSAGTYTVIVTDSAGCTETQVANIKYIDDFVLFAGSSTPDQLECLINNGTATVIPMNGKEPYSYLWNTGQTTTTATQLGTGTYTVIVSDANGCEETQTLTVLSTPNPLMVTDSSSQAGCSINNGTATAFPENGAEPYTYYWSNEQTTPTATALATGTYTVTVTDANGCTKTDTVTITQTLTKPTATAGASDTTITLGDSTLLKATGNGIYLWFPAAELSCGTCANPIAFPAQTTVYCVTVTDANNCTDSACVTIYVEIPCRELFVPSAFSPNSDGTNDVLYVQANCVQQLEFKIYDRWGNEVFQSTNVTEGWDGTYNGKPMNAAVLVYYLQAILTDGKSVNKKGNISLVR